MPYRPAHPLSAAGSSRIDMLRLALVGQVLLGHYAMIAYPRFPDLDFGRAADVYVGLFRLVSRFGSQAAFVFVCISGYFLVPRLLATALKVAGAEPIGAFLLGRLKRIYPTLVAALALTLICDAAGIWGLGAEPFYRRFGVYDAVAALDWRTGLGNLLSLQPTWSDAFGTNGPLWTLGYIVQFYCIGALLAEALRRGRRTGLAVALAIIALGLAFAPVWLLVLACWLSCALVRWIKPAGRKQAWLELLLGLGLFVAANRLPVNLGIMACGISGCLWLHALNSDLPVRRLVQLPPALQRLNAASFGIYAFHFPLAVLAYAAIAPHVDTAGLLFRVAWPVIAAAPVIVLAFQWQNLMQRRFEA